MGAVQSTVNPSVEGRYLAVLDVHQFSTRSMPEDSGTLPCYIVSKSGQIGFYLRCLKNGRVRNKLIFYCKQKTNKNFRIYKPGFSTNPIGYIKKRHHAYRVYFGRTYCAKIVVQRQGTTIGTKMIIAGHQEFEFSSVRRANRPKPKKIRVDCLHPCSLFQAFCFAVLC